jgi:hypothetical protein
MTTTYLDKIKATVDERFAGAKDYADSAYSVFLDFMGVDDPRETGLDGDEDEDGGVTRGLASAVRALEIDTIDLDFEIPMIPTNDYSPVTPELPTLEMGEVTAPSGPVLTDVTVGDVEFSNMDGLVPAVPVVEVVTVGEVEFPNMDGLVPAVPGVEVVEVGDVEFPNMDGLVPAAPSLEVVAVGEVEFPSLGSSAPVFSIPVAPSVSWPDQPGGRPVFSDVELPTRPDVTLPTPPSIDRVTIGAAPTIRFPSFDGEYPTTELVAPEIDYSYSEEAYQSALAEKLKAVLADAVENGGTGLGEEAEAALWARARARNAAKNEAMYDEANEYFAARGHELPPGALSGRLLQIQGEVSRAEDDINNDITVETARLAQEWAKIVVQVSAQYEGQLMNFHSQSAQRGFESAKFAQEAAIRIFEALVAKFNADLERYKTAASVYEIGVRAALLELERYKAELEGKRLEADVQKVYVDIYGAQIQALESVHRFYAVDMEGARLKVEVEKARLEAYREDVNAYVAGINANTARFNAYESQVRGEVAKADVWSRQVQAFEAETQAAKARGDMQIATAQARIEANRMEVERYKADVGMYAEKSQAETQAAKVRGDLQIATAQARIEANRMLTEQYKADVGMYAEKSQAETQAAKVRGDLQIATAQARIEANRMLTEQYKADVGLYAEKAQAETQAAKVRGDLQLATAQAQIEANRMLTEQYKADVGMYAEQVRAEIAKLESLARVYGAGVEAYRADVQLAGVKIDADIKSYDVQSRHEQARLELALKQAAQNLEAAIKNHELQVEALKAGASVSAQLCASAMSSVSAAAQMSYRGGYDTNYSYDKTKRDPETKHFYNYSA